MANVKKNLGDFRRKLNLRPVFIWHAAPVIPWRRNKYVICEIKIIGKTFAAKRLEFHIPNNHDQGRTQKKKGDWGKVHG